MPCDNPVTALYRLKRHDCLAAAEIAVENEGHFHRSVCALRRKGCLSGHRLVISVKNSISGQFFDQRSRSRIFSAGNQVAV